MFQAKGCAHCKGDLMFDEDLRSRKCCQCGRMPDIEYVCIKKPQRRRTGTLPCEIGDCQALLASEPARSRHHREVHGYYKRGPQKQAKRAGK
jgi:hypothetical protein